jgi:glutamine synthetase
MLFYALLATGLEGPLSEPEDNNKRPRTRFLPDNIYDAIRLFKSSRFLAEQLGEDIHAKFAEIKVLQAERCPKALGTIVKAYEIQFHHEVTNQLLWSQF